MSTGIATFLKQKKKGFFCFTGRLSRASDSESSG
jgi:hypothetical protein